MLLYIVRHGDPIYNPDSLTEKGHLQAQALAKRLATHGIDKIYSSPLIRAQQTAHPTEVLLGKKLQIEEWTSEYKAFSSFSVEDNGVCTWIFHSSKKSHLREPEVEKLGYNWYEAPAFEGIDGKGGYEYLRKASDEFLSRHGYEHDFENKRYIAKNGNDEKIAVFCHQGFSISWLGVMLDIPLPVVWTTMDINHSCMTVVEFKEDKDGLCIPKIITLSNDSHLYKEGLPTQFQNGFYY